MAFIGFFTFIIYVFMAAINSKIYKSLVFTLGILFALHTTINDLYPVVERWNNKLERGIDAVERVAGKDGWDLPVKGRITQRFNPPNHHGIDIEVQEGTPVYAQDGGKVVLAEFQEVYGNVVIVRYDNGYEGVYAHLSEINVKNGDLVYRGIGKTMLLGKTGNTGKSKGPHLHYEVRFNNIAIDPMSL